MVATREGQVVSAELSFGDARLTVGGAWENIKPPAALEGANTQIIHVVVDSGLDAHCERARQAGATIIAEPREQFYGERTYAATDLEGHHWNFSQPVRQVTFEEMERATGFKYKKLV